MKIANFQPFTLSDYPGYCAAIIFTIGCNFRCSYCHNKILWDENTKQISEEKLFDFLQAKQGKIDGVVITGGEPTLQTDLEDFIRKIKDLGYKVKLDTNGSNPLVLKKLIDRGLLDYIAMDIKAPFSKYAQLSGTPISIPDIQKSIDIIAKSGVKHIFRTTWDKKLLTEADLEAIRKLLPQKSAFVVQECLGGITNCE